LQRICGETASETADRYRPIVQRKAQMPEQQAIEEAANALTALWKVGRSKKT